MTRFLRAPLKTLAPRIFLSLDPRERGKELDLGVSPRPPPEGTQSPLDSRCFEVLSLGCRCVIATRVPSADPFDVKDSIYAAEVLISFFIR